LARDPANCGACGRVCGQGTTCAAGQCVPVQCPPDTRNGCSGTATCYSYDNTYSTEGLCCAHGQTAYCCADSLLGTNDGSAGCCTEGVDCNCPNTPLGAVIASPSLDCCDPANATNPVCQDNGQPLVGYQCCGWSRGGDAKFGIDYIPQGEPCNPDWRCQYGFCRDGICGCGLTGDACDTTDHICCSGNCVNGACVCNPVGE